MDGFVDGCAMSTSVVICFKHSCPNHAFGYVFAPPSPNPPPAPQLARIARKSMSQSRLESPAWLLHIVRLVVEAAAGVPLGTSHAIATSAYEAARSRPKVVVRHVGPTAVAPSPPNAGDRGKSKGGGEGAYPERSKEPHPSSAGKYASMRRGAYRWTRGNRHG